MAVAAPAVQRQTLNRQRVLAAALAHVDEHGLAGLSMRRLGTALGVEGMSIYKHVEDKDALLDGIVELLWTEVRTPGPRIGWRRALRELADGVRDLFQRHPNAAPLLAIRNCLNAGALRCYDAYLDALLRNGFDRRRALDAVGAVIGHALGFALLEVRCAAPADAGPRQAVAPAPGLPAPLADLAAEIAATCSSDSCFTVSIDALLTGLAPTVRTAPARRLPGQ